MTTVDSYDWNLLKLWAEFHLTARLQGARLGTPDTAVGRIRSGMYVIGYSEAREPHAVCIAPVVDEVTKIRQAIRDPGQLPEARARIYDVFGQIAVCGVEARLNDFGDAKVWIPSKTACPGCVAKC